jgi:ribonucrease Y
MMFFDGLLYPLISLMLVSCGLIFCLTIFIYARRRIAALAILEAQLKKDIELERKESLGKLKDDLHRRKNDAEADLRRERQDLERAQQKFQARLDALDTRESRLLELQSELQHKERALLRSTDQIHTQEHKLKQLHDDLIGKLEALACISREDAKTILLNTLEAEVRATRERWISKVEEEARITAKERSITILANAMQRYTADTIAPHSSGIVHLPNDEMKGRIIGKEGRNIKSLEMATGMEFVIGETPEIITISGFNPIRREVARRSLEKLIADGRINPTRIEETVTQCEQEIEEMIEDYGKQAVMKFNLAKVNPEVISLLGKLHFRTSFSQNVLMHSYEVGIFSRLIAQELGMPNPTIALRGGLLHDIGKALSAECEGPHALLGAEVARRCGEDPLVVNAIAAHHEEEPDKSIYAVLVRIADTISASRPGARRETLSTYIKRLEQLENLALEQLGVKKAYALQAGREIRVIVEEQQVTDEHALQLARDLAARIEKEMAFPGQIKVHVIRETRAIEYAR